MDDTVAKVPAFIAIHLSEISLGLWLSLSPVADRSVPQEHFLQTSMQPVDEAAPNTREKKLIHGCQWFLPADELTLLWGVVLKLSTFLYFKMCLGFINVSSVLCS